MILALALTALVLVILGMAIDFHLRALDNGRSHVEEAQLARAVLQLIATDLRSALRPNPIKIDESALQLSVAPTNNPPTNNPPTNNPPTNNPPTNNPPTNQDPEGQPTEEPVEVPDVVSSTCPQAVPGIYGTADALQVDKSRLPRLDEFLTQAPTASGLPGVQPTGNIRTVTYFVVPPDGTLTGQSAGGLSPTCTGLVRRDLDRSVATYMESMGGMSDPQMGLESIAPEVAAIEFLYFDGAEWTDLWNSEELGGLPRAVQIRVSIIPKKLRERGVSSSATAGTLMPEDLLTYSLVVYLPGSEGTTASQTPIE